MPVPIILTGTIIPNMMEGDALNSNRRRDEYCRAIQFYRELTEVHFLENSEYALGDDPEFRDGPNLKIWKFPKSERAERGKGYQEFEMLDSWIDTADPLPKKWLKITGRYVIENVADILEECERRESPMIIDQVPKSRIARTYLFYVQTDIYESCLRGIYQKCDDTAGKWIERELYDKLRVFCGVQSFMTQPKICAIAGSSGKKYPVGNVQWVVKQSLRRLNRLFDRRYLWYSN